MRRSSAEITSACSASRLRRDDCFADADDTTPGGNPVAVLSFNYWKTHLGADPSVVGQTLSINGQPFQIIGVSAPEFQSAVWGTGSRCLRADVDAGSGTGPARADVCRTTKTAG